MKYSNFGRIIGRNKDFYIIKCSTGEYHIIESSDELEIESIISWDNSNSCFYDESYSLDISALMQWEYISLQEAISTLKSLY